MNSNSLHDRVSFTLLTPVLALNTKNVRAPPRWPMIPIVPLLRAHTVFTVFNVYGFTFYGFCYGQNSIRFFSFYVSGVVIIWVAKESTKPSLFRN